MVELEYRTRIVLFVRRKIHRVLVLGARLLVPHEHEVAALQRRTRARLAFCSGRCARAASCSPAIARPCCRSSRAPLPWARPSPSSPAFFFDRLLRPRRRTACFLQRWVRARAALCSPASAATVCRAGARTRVRLTMSRFTTRTRRGRACSIIYIIENRGVTVKDPSSIIHSFTRTHHKDPRQHMTAR